MKNKLLVSAFAVVCLMFVGCRQEKDDAANICSDIALKTIVKHPYYSFVEVDSVKMNTTLYEWYLTENKSGKIGYTRKSATGNGLDSDNTDSLTWSAVRSDDNLSMVVSANMKRGDAQTILWRNGVVETNKYVTASHDISRARVLRTLHDQFKNMTFEVDDTIPMIYYDKYVYKYLHWNTSRGSVTLDPIQIYNEYLKQFKDTIAWFNKSEYSNYGKNAVADTVKHGKPNASGLCTAIFPVSEEKALILTDTIKLGPAKIVNGKMHYNVVAGVYTGDFELRIQQWNLDYYMYPTDETATYSDSAYSIKNAVWTPKSYVNGTEFSILMKGDETKHQIDSVAGKETRNESSAASAAYHTVALKEYDKTDSIPTIVVGEVKFKQVK